MRCKSCKSSPFSPLLRNKGVSFLHAFRCLSVRDKSRFNFSFLQVSSLYIFI